MGVDAGNLHDRAAGSLLFHLAGAELREKKRSREIDIQHALPFLEIHLEEWLHVIDPRVVDETIDASEAGERASNQVFNLVRADHVGHDCLRLGPGRADFSRDGFEFLL